MKTTSIGGKGDTREVAVSVGVVLLWLRVLVVAALLIGAAHAQTLVTQPTTTTLWAGSQDTTLPLNFILGSVSTTQEHAVPAATRSPATTRQIKDNRGAINAPGVRSSVHLDVVEQLCAYQREFNPGDVQRPRKNAITCNLGTVNGGVTVNFNVGPAAGTFTTTGSATFAGTDTNPANNTFNVTIQSK